MAIVTIPKKQFESEIGKIDSKMQDRIAMFGTPLEEINDKEILIEVFPNRPDLLSYHGFKRSFLGFLGKNKGLKKYKAKKAEKNYIVKIDSSVKNIRPSTACAIVKGIKLDNEKIKELIEIQEKLHITLGRKRKKLAIGIYPLEKIKLPIYYKALEPDKIKFLPLGFSRVLSGLEILQKHPTGKEYAHLLAGKLKFPIFTDANNNILSMPPIINSTTAGKIDINTKNVFIECSGFDFSVLNKCLNIIVTTLADMGGSIYEMKLEYNKKEITPNLNPTKMKISLDNTNKLLGLKLGEKELKNNLEKMGYHYNKGSVEIPCYRTDILHAVDLIEDVAIAYGYENFDPIIPEIATVGQANNISTLNKKISEILTGLNILEVSNYHLTKKEDQFTKMEINPKNQKGIYVKESKTDYDTLRTNISHYLLKNLSENIDEEYPQKIFEIGTVFSGTDKVSEENNLGLAITPGNFTDTKQILDYLFRMLNINKKIKLVEPKKIQTHFIEGRVAQINYNNKEIGYLGEIHPKILKNWKIKMPITLFEIKLDDIYKDLI